MQTTTETPAPPASAPIDEQPYKFELHRYNPRRAARGKEAAEVKITHPDGDIEYLWMSKKDINNNIKDFGVSDGLLECLTAYKNNKEI